MKGAVSTNHAVMRQTNAHLVPRESERQHERYASMHRLSRHQMLEEDACSGASG